MVTIIMNIIRVTSRPACRAPVCTDHRHSKSFDLRILKNPYIWKKVNHSQFVSSFRINKLD